MDKKQQVFGGVVSIETERLILRKLQRSDADDFYAYASNPAVSRFLPWEPHRSIEDTEKLIEVIFKSYEQQEKLIWAIEKKDDGKMIGTIDFIKWLPKHGRAEIAYALSCDYWGLGYMPEAAKALLAFGFHNMELNKIEAAILLDNHQSRSVLEKIGMSFEGVARQHFKMKGEFVDLAMYSVLRSEFLAQ